MGPPTVKECLKKGCDSIFAWEVTTEQLCDLAN